MSSGGPSSTTLPLYNTTTLVLMYLITEMSWEMIMYVRFSCLLRSESSSSICACRDTSRADVGSSSIMILGLVARALAIATL